MRNDKSFTNVRSLVGLSIKLVDTNKNQRHVVVYMLLKLVLVLRVATASVERVFSVMNYVNNKLRNKVGNQYFNDCLVHLLSKSCFYKLRIKTSSIAFKP